MSQDCASCRGDLGAYVLGALDAEERAATRAHLARCAACHADYEYLLPVRGWLASTRQHLATCRTCYADYEELLESGGLLPQTRYTFPCPLTCRPLRDPTWPASPGQRRVAETSETRIRSGKWKRLSRTDSWSQSSPQDAPEPA